VSTLGWRMRCDCDVTCWRCAHTMQSPHWPSKFADWKSGSCRLDLGPGAGTAWRLAQLRAPRRHRWMRAQHAHARHHDASPDGLSRAAPRRTSPPARDGHRPHCGRVAPGVHAAHTTQPAQHLNHMTGAHRQASAAQWERASQLAYGACMRQRWRAWPRM
jgi:hypothetical protein